MSDKKRKAAGSKRVDRRLREDMFQAYEASGGSIARVVKICKVHRITAKKWRIRDRWDVRLARIEVATEKKLEKKIINRRLRNVQVLDTAIEKIKDDIEAGTADLEAKSLAKLVATQELLLGRGAADEIESTIPPEAIEAINILSQLGDSGLRLLGDRLADASGGAEEIGRIAEPPVLLVDHTGKVKRVGKKVGEVEAI